MRSRPTPSAAALLLAAGLFVAGFLAGPGAARTASADRTTAAAALPADDANPFFAVRLQPGRSSKLDDLARKPEFVAYASGAFLIQKSDDRLWRGQLSQDETLDLLDFLLSDAKFPSIALDYLVGVPFTNTTVFGVRTRSGSWSVERRDSGGLGSGVADATARLKRIDARRFALADRADTPYKPGVLLVVTRRIEPDVSTPMWAWSAQAPFAGFRAASDIEKGMGAIVDGERATAIRDAVAQGPRWRFGADACEIRMRPALPHELTLPRWGSPPAPALPPPAATDPTPAPAPAPGPLPAPTPGPVPFAEPPPAVAAPETPPAPPFPAAEPAAGGEWKDDDLDFAGVQALVKALKKKASGSPHGVFWDKKYEDFVGFEFELAEPEGRVRLIDKGHGATSNFIHGLKGEPLKIVKADGTIIEKAFDAMPQGKPMAEADIERIRRWIDHGAPEKRPEGPAAPTAPSAPPAPPATVPEVATPTGATITLHLVGEGTANLGPSATVDSGDVDPSLYVARSESDWKAVFDTWVADKSGPNGKALARELRIYRDGALGYDYGSSQLFLLLSPAMDGYEWTLEPVVQAMSDGTGRIPLTGLFPASPKHKAGKDVLVRWALYRSASDCPPTGLRAPSGRMSAPSNAR